MSRFASQNIQSEAIKNFIDNLSDIDVDDSEDDSDSSSEGLYSFYVLFLMFFVES